VSNLEEKSYVGRSFEELDKEEMEDVIGNELKVKESKLVCALISGGISALVSIVVTNITKKLM